MSFFITLAAVVLLGWLLGRWLGRRFCTHPTIPSFKSGGFVVGLGVLWFVAAWLTRSYADTDHPGAVLAEWFAHTGKWWTLLTALMVGHGAVGSLKQIPSFGPRRALYFGMLFTLITLTSVRMIPIYFLLGDGQRDAQGYIRQSRDYEYTCAGVALLNYLEQYRCVKGLTERALSQACGTTLEGSTTAALVRAARGYGLTNAAARVLTEGELARHGRPAIVSISTLPSLRHATLLVRLDAQQAHFIDPSYGTWIASRERFRKIWYGKTVLLE